MTDRSIGMAHGYGLSGSGSNVWAGSVAGALCGSGVDVHLLCQESRPEEYDFVAEAWSYGAEGEPTRLFRRATEYPGRCIVHRPELEVLPTYVRPGKRSDYVVWIGDLDSERIERYLDLNGAVLRRLVHEHGVRRVHVNHVLLLSEAVRRLKAETGVPYAIMPHGSAIEYVVRRVPGMREVAERALRESDLVLLLNEDIARRLGEIFPDLPRLAERSRTVRAGVDTDLFGVVAPADRRAAFGRVEEALAEAGRGRSPEQTRAFLDRLDGVRDIETFREVAAEASAHASMAPDEDVEERLGEVRWGVEPVVLFVGRLIPEKGVPSLVTAFPRILEAHPDARLLLVGSGSLREPLEAFVHALGSGRAELALKILEWGDALGAGSVSGFEPSRRYVERLREDGGGLEAWMDGARRLDLDRVVFTGFMRHDVLRHLFPLADVAVFPSAVTEGSPLVVAEAAASGCFPMGTDFAGMGHTLRAVERGVPPDLRERMRIRPEAEHTVRDIAGNVSAVLDSTNPGLGESLHRVAVEEFDWRTIARTLRVALDELDAPDEPDAHPPTRAGG